MNIKCPHCQNRDYILKYSLEKFNTNFKVVKCSICGHFYTYYNSNIDTESLYKTDAYIVDDQRKSIFYKIQEYEYSKVLCNIKSFAKKGKSRLLDFGSGKGHFLFMAKNEDFDVRGVETAKNRADFCKEKYEIPVFSNFYDGKSKIDTEKFDVITLFHVLEHLYEPDSIVDGLYNENLNDDGIFIIEVPNFGSWQSLIAGKHWLHLDIPRHINHYNIESLIKSQANLKGGLLKVETFSAHLGVIGMLQSLMSIFGYRDSLINDLKFNKRLGIYLSLSFLIFPAFILEIIASGFNKGGVIRIYLKK